MCVYISTVVGRIPNFESIYIAEPHGSVEFCFDD
jgi:hypothetical protein